MKNDEDFDICSLRERPYLGAHSLPIAKDGNRKCVVVIENIRGQEVIGAKGKKAGKAVMFFKGISKGLILNATAEKTLFLLFGTTMKSKLIGQKIGLFATTTRYADGSSGPCVRIHPARVDGAAAVGPELAKQMDAASQDPALQAQQEAASGEGAFYDSPRSEIPVAEEDAS